METYDVIVNQPVVIDNVSLRNDYNLCFVCWYIGRVYCKKTQWLERDKIQ